MVVEPGAQWVVVRVAGELDHATCQVLTEQLQMVVEDPSDPHVAVDVSELDFCDSSGLRCLVTAWKRVRRRGGEMVLLQPRDPLRLMIARTGLGSVLRIADELPH